MKHLTRTAALALAACVLAGCSDSDVREVQQWMDETRASAKVRVKPLSAPKEFIPLAYEGGDTIDPFTQDKLLSELARTDATSDNPLKPDMDRRKELLETYPLDTMQMVGLLQKGGVNHALVQIDRQVHQVRAGQRIGQNFGIVTSVSEREVNIREIVQDAAGDWVERMSKLELQESKETAK